MADTTKDLIDDVIAKVFRLGRAEILLGMPEPVEPLTEQQRYAMVGEIVGALTALKEWVPRGRRGS